MHIKDGKQPDAIQAMRQYGESVVQTAIRKQLMCSRCRRVIHVGQAFSSIVTEDGMADVHKECG